MSKIATTALVVVASVFIAEPALAGPMDEWCQTQAKRPSSIVICSDYVLRQLAFERQKAFDEARQELDTEDYKALLEDQNRWVKSYTAKCGVPFDGPPAPNPIPWGIIDCYRREGAVRISYIRAYGVSIFPEVPNSNFPDDSSAKIQAEAKAKAEIDEAAAKARAEVVEAAKERARIAARRDAEEAEREAAKVREKLEREAKEKHDEEIAQFAQGKGFKLITFDDFQLDSKELANTGDKIALRGYYMSANEAEGFIPSLRHGASDEAIRIFTDDADREARKLFLECRKSGRSACPFMIMGRVSNCTRKFDEKQVPCVTVLDAREYGKPE